MLNANSPTGSDKPPGSDRSHDDSQREKCPTSLGHPSPSPGLTGVFIIGTDTEVGKTYQACRWAEILASRGIRVGVYKPVASGHSPESPSDAELLQRAAQSPQPLHRICPQTFLAPVAPPVAAHLEGRQVDERLLREGALWWQPHCDFLIVEGAGGGLSPLSASLTVLDLAQSLGLPVVLVAANRLGAVNHVLLTLEAVHSRGLLIKGVVLNALPTLAANLSDSDEARRTNRDLLSRFVNPQLAIVDSVEPLIDSGDFALEGK